MKNFLTEEQAASLEEMFRKPKARPDECHTVETSRPTGQKNDAGKLRYDLLPFFSMDVIVAVLNHGAEKYGAENWKSVEEAERRYMAAALRHISKHQQGEENDPESGLPHLAHAACSLLFLIEIQAGNGQPHP